MEHPVEPDQTNRIKNNEMKHTGIYFLSLILAAGCSSVSPDEPDGYLRIDLNVNPSVGEITSKSSDPATFTLEILRDGNIVKTISPVGDAIAPIALSAGSYTLSAYSETFTVPAFDKPVYGGSSPAAVVSGVESNASVSCAQTNAGIRIGYTDNFKTNRTNYSTVVRQIQGSLAFAGADAERTGYFFADNATFVVSADDLNYEYDLTLEPRKIYDITIDDAYRPTGELSVSITVTTETTQEPVDIVIPSGKVDYTENMGAVAVSVNTPVGSYGGWSSSEAGYSGSGVWISTESPSDTYAGASGGNHLLFKNAGSNFTVSGLNTSLAPAGLTLSFGCCCTDRNFDTNDLTVSVSTDGGTTFSPLSIGTDARASNKKWAQITVETGIPKAKDLSIRFDCLNTGYLLDDIVLKTTN